MRLLFLLLVALNSFAQPGRVVNQARPNRGVATVLPDPADFIRTTITVADGAANTFVYKPLGVNIPPTGGWPVAIFFGGDGTSNNNTNVVTAVSTSTGDNLTYTSAPSIGGFRMMPSSIVIKSNGTPIGRGNPNGSITGTGITTGAVTSFDDGTPSVSFTFSSSQAANTITYDYVNSTVFIEGPMRLANLFDTFDNRVIVICIQNIGNNVLFDRDYFDETVKYAWMNYSINPNRISCWGISRGGRGIIEELSNGANTSILKSRWEFWINRSTGVLTTTDPVNNATHAASGVASLVIGTATYGGSFTAANYTNIGMAIVHGTADGTLTNGTPGFSATMASNNEPPYIYNVYGGFHNTDVWDGQCFDRLYRVGGAGNAPWDYVDFTLKYSRNVDERATLHVEQAEKRRYNTEKDIIDYRHAVRKVAEMAGGAPKTALEARLATLKTAIDNGGTRWVINFHSSGNSEASPYNNFDNATAGTTISNIINFDAGSSALDVELDTNPGGGLIVVGSSRRTFTGGFSKTANESGLVLTGFPFGTFKFTGTPAGTYTVRFYHNVGVANFSTDPRIRVTINSVTKSAYSGINSMLGFIEFTGVTAAHLDQFDTSLDTSANTILTIMEIYRNP